MDMNIEFASILAGLFAAVCCAAAVPTTQAGNAGGLDARQEAIVPIAAFAASGDLEKLKQALNEGLDAGLTVNEIKEILVQLYAYAGFPRSLNAIGSFMEVIEERGKKGIRDEIGKEAGALPAQKSRLELGTKIQTQLVGKPVAGPIFTFAPAIDRFLKDHLFGDIFGRDNLDFKSREIATLAALANMEGLSSQMASHFKISLNIGLTQMQLKSLISVIESRVGQYQADNAAAALANVLGSGQAGDKARKISVSRASSNPPRQGPAEWFTGSVRIDSPFKAPEPAHFSGAIVVFEAGSRTAWHSHKLGQLLIVTSGTGHVQSWGNPVQEIRTGDVVWIPPFQKHWHGAALDSPMTHIAIVEERHGESTRWLEMVSDEQYRSKSE
jgi:4-carboxymuconolactone decarboxylase